MLLACLLSSATALSAPTEDPTILELASTLPTLAAAIEAAELEGALSGDGPFTVFAPSEEAFAALPDGALANLLETSNKSALADVLLYHVASGDVSAADALAAGSVTTLLGETVDIALNGGRVRIGSASLLTNDLKARNGVVHVIDTVLLPPVKDVPMDPATLVIASAIDRGAPLFNAGQPAACAAVYETATLALATLDGAVATPVADVLADSLATARRTSDAAERAWALREGLDRALELLEGGGPKAETAAYDPDVVFDFTRSEAAWLPVNDDVMGGISSCRYTPTTSGTALFEGALSLENNGGFATIRSQATDLSLEGAAGVVLRVRGDGRSYTFSALKRDARMEINLWRVDFDTVADEWVDVRIPFAALSHSVMGYRVPNAPNLDPATIRSFSFGISDKDTTPFRLEIDTIRAYGADI